MFSVCAFPYILAFTTDSIEIRLVVNGNLVYTAVVPELQLAASRVSMITCNYTTRAGLSSNQRMLVAQSPKTSCTFRLLALCNFFLIQTNILARRYLKIFSRCFLKLHAQQQLHSVIKEDIKWI